MSHLELESQHCARFKSDKRTFNQIPKTDLQSYALSCGISPYQNKPQLYAQLTKMKEMIRSVSLKGQNPVLEHALRKFHNACVAIQNSDPSTNNPEAPWKSLTALELKEIAKSILLKEFSSDTIDRMLKHELVGLLYKRICGQTLPTTVSGGTQTETQTLTMPPLEQPSLTMPLLEPPSYEPIVGEMEFLRKRISELEQERMQCQDESREALVRAERERDQLRLILNECDTKTKKLENDLRQAFLAQERTKATQITELEIKIQNVQQTVRDKDFEISRLQSDLLVLRQTNEDLKRNQCNQLDIQRERQRFFDVQSNLDRLHAQVADLKYQNDRLRERPVAMDIQRDDTIQKDLEQEIAKLVRQLEDERRQTQRLRTQLNERKYTPIPVDTSKEDEIRDLRDQLDDERQKSKVLKDVKDDEIARLKKRLNESKYTPIVDLSKNNEIQDLRDQLENERKKSQTKDEEIRDLRTKLNDEIRKSQIVNDQNTQLRREKSDMESQINEHESRDAKTVKDWTEAYEKGVAENKRLRKQLDELEAQLERQSKTLSESKTTIDAKEDELKRLQSTLNEKQLEYQATINTLTSQIQQTVADSKEKENKIELKTIEYQQSLISDLNTILPRLEFVDTDIISRINKLGEYIDAFTIFLRTFNRPQTAGLPLAIRLTPPALTYVRPQELKTQLVKYEQDVQSLRRDLVDKDAETSRLLKLAQQRANELADLESNIRRLKEDLKTKDQQIRDLALSRVEADEYNRLSEIETITRIQQEESARQLFMAESELKRVQQQLQKSQTDYQNDTNRLQTDINRLNQELSRLQNCCQDLDRLQNLLKKCEDDAKTNIQQLQIAFSQEQANRMEMARVLNDCEQTNGYLRQQIATLQFQASNLEQQIQQSPQFQAFLQSVNTLFAQIQQSNKLLEQKVEGQVVESKQVQQQLQQAQTALIGVTGQVAQAVGALEQVGIVRPALLPPSGTLQITGPPQSQVDIKVLATACDKENNAGIFKRCDEALFRHYVPPTDPITGVPLFLTTQLRNEEEKRILQIRKRYIDYLKKCEKATRGDNKEPTIKVQHENFKLFLDQMTTNRFDLNRYFNGEINLFGDKTGAASGIGNNVCTTLARCVPAGVCGSDLAARLVQPIEPMMQLRRPLAPPQPPRLPQPTTVVSSATAAQVQGRGKKRRDLPQPTTLEERHEREQLASLQKFE